MFIEFKSKKAEFNLWQSDLKASSVFKPDEFIVLDERSKLTGDGCFSNLVKRTDKEEFTVRTYAGDVVYKGLYDRAESDKHMLTLKKAMIVLDGNTMVEYQFSGNSMFATNDQLKNIDMNNYKVKFAGIKQVDSKKGKQNVPVWEQGSEITKEERNEAIGKVEILKEYFNS